MINVVPYEELGEADFGWLKAKYHFSFGRYHNPARMGFGKLRVINDDIVSAGAGFDEHGHDNMEIITYVRKGAITHEDSLGNSGRTKAGDIQVMSAGNGIRHAEYNKENQETTLYQIWIDPSERDIDPRWDAAQFPKEAVNDQLALMVSGREEHDGEAKLKINADAAIYAGRLEKGTKIQQLLKYDGYILVSNGEVSVNGTPLKKGDGAEISDLDEIEIISNSLDAELLVIDIPK